MLASVVAVTRFVLAALLVAGVATAPHPALNCPSRTRGGFVWQCVTWWPTSWENNRDQDIEALQEFYRLYR